MGLNKLYTFCDFSSKQIKVTKFVTMMVSTKS